MAKIQYTAFVSDMRGKVAGTVFSRNKFGAYTRTKVTPTNPASSAQTQARSRFTGFSQGWRGLTAAQRLQWIDASTNFPKTNQFGATYYQTGAQLYQGLNNTLSNVGASNLTAPPTPAAVTAVTSASLTMAKGAATASLVFAPSPIPANTSFIVFATAGVSPGVSFVKNLYRQITVLAAAATTPANIAAVYVAKFGAIPAAGQVVFLKIVPVNTLTGQQGQAFQVSAVVAA